MNNVLVLVNNYFGFFPEESESIKIVNLYHKHDNSLYIKRVLRKIHLNSFLPYKEIWFEKWYLFLGSVNTVILFDNGNIDCVVKWIHKKYPAIRIIIWYWGPVDICISPSKFNRDYCELWSFDKRDCNDYSMRFNTQFFIMENLYLIENVKNDYKFDVVFVGTEKDRLSKIVKCKELFDSFNINNYMHVVKSKSHYSSNDKYKYKEPIDYKEMLRLISSSRSVLDVVSNDQSGLTLRPLEALFLKRKLITNDRKIVDYDLYNRKNIFILGVDNENQLRDFVFSEYDYTNYDELIMKYSFHSWIERFFD